MKTKVPQYLGVTQDGKKLELHEDAVSQGFADFGRRGMGKSNLLACMLEIFAQRKHPFVVLDPPDAHWGIRFATDESGRPSGPSGFDVLIVGGDHGDVPLNPEKGKELANIIVDGDISAVICMRSLGYTAQQRFCADFGEELFRINRTPRFIGFEEAHNFLPQQLKFDEQKRVLYAMQKFISEGRGSGLGFCLASQRPAVVNKDALEEVENFFALGMMGPGDLDQMERWFKRHVKGDKDKLQAILDDIAQMSPGECWFLSPVWQKEIVRLRVRMRVTYHSGRTPKFGERAVNLAKFTLPEAIDKLKTLFSQKSVAVQQDIKDLGEAKKRIRELEKLVSSAPKPKALPPITTRPVVDTRAISRAVSEAVSPYRIQTAAMEKALRDAAFRATNIATSAAELANKLKLKPFVAPKVSGAEIPRKEFFLSENDLAKVPSNVSDRKHLTTTPITPRPDVTYDGEKLPEGELAVLKAAAQYGEDGIERNTITTLTGYKRSTRDAYVLRLRNKGLTEETRGGKIKATETGIAALGSDFEPLPVGGELQKYWLKELPEGEKKILEVMLTQGQGAEIEREWITEQTTFKRSTRDAYLLRMRSKQIVDDVGRSKVKVSDILFD